MIFTNVAGFDYTELITWPTKRVAILYDVKKNLVVPLKDLPKHKKQAFPRGGILADEMGLGYFYFLLFPFILVTLFFFFRKTIETIGLVSFVIVSAFGHINECEYDVLL